ncbi:class I SAM-dependent methyltransferase [Tunicatimonas pelagia]|uniref:class I SAM-dependent methyltransferase n=1 Tax=Tunicatimonas pelagia TaxID=931531 RepID=UPI002665DA6F|nr:class I SAM-dependent methyltransferase [Tunicatimonas pelagia]WKN44157.1 class I SAM-dependent methyltransferase [Tunicatimonas pelagia]
MNEQEIAAQLAHPHGERAAEVGEKLAVSNQTMIRGAMDALALAPGDRVLEIGMAAGRHVDELLRSAPRGYAPRIHYTGVDISEDMVQEAQRINASWVAAGQAKFIAGSSDRLPFADQQFTKILSVNTLYFWNPLTAHLREIVRVLQPGGRLVLGFGSRDFMQQLPFTQHGFNLYQPEEMATQLQHHGLEVVDVQHRKNLGEAEGYPGIQKDQIILTAIHSNQ